MGALASVFGTYRETPALLRASCKRVARTCQAICVHAAGWRRSCLAPSPTEASASGSSWRRSGSGSGTGSTGTTSPRSPTSRARRRTGRRAIVFGTLYALGQRCRGPRIGTSRSCSGNSSQRASTPRWSASSGLTLIVPRRLRVRVADPARAGVPDAEPLDADLQRVSDAWWKIIDRRSVRDATSHDHEREPVHVHAGGGGEPWPGRPVSRVAPRSSWPSRPSPPQAPGARRPFMEYGRGRRSSSGWSMGSAPRRPRRS